MSANATVRFANVADCEAIARIYNHYIRDTIITFEEQEVAASDIEGRLNEVRAAGLPWLVSADSNGVSLHVAIGGISLPNPASVKLHEQLGFEKVTHFREVGFKFGRWIDVGYWQRTP